MMKKKWIHTGLFAVLLALSAVLVGWALKANADFRRASTDDYSVSIFPEKYRYITEKEVVEIIKRYDRKDTAEIVRAEIVEMRLEKHPFIANAEAYIGLNGKLAVEIEQFKPLAYVDFGHYRKVMDDKGYLKPVPKHDRPQLPVITGVHSESGLRKLFPVVKAMMQDPFFKRKLARISRRDGTLYIKLYGISPEITMGGTNSYRTKMEKTKEIIRTLKQTNRLHLYKNIDVRYRGQIICKK
jgi:cell division septal protein FtsQ